MKVEELTLQLIVEEMKIGTHPILGLSGVELPEKANLVCICDNIRFYTTENFNQVLIAQRRDTSIALFTTDMQSTIEILLEK